MTAFLAKVMAGLATLGASLHHPPRELDPPMSSATASWYDQPGIGACGVDAQAGLHFASLILQCGTRVRFCYAGCAIGTMADRGPFISGRTFDLNVNLRSAIHCSDLCTVQWRIVR